ncbi:hypothetical protein K6119_16300 [Paracrocinitomix mangrovi]|uniref:hypothetical protein n=1 Tax=Paracrocinitomix mangrovi TaxID=2862509 RepID=UPI001C8D45AA|nr:hypothetical protein [Paracrocinitomix mangrovi]UKN01290.1 hypothetical protein K6119_16300 [Paracrocinitomix mangrovi]
MKKWNKLFGLIVIAGLTVTATSCNKVKDGKVITDTYDGNVSVTSTGANAGGDFTGTGDNGVYAFGWENNKSKAEVNFDITTPTGSLNFKLEDADKKEVLNETRYAGSNDTYSGVSLAGASGVWTVTLTFSDFNGNGSYSLSPID